MAVGPVAVVSVKVEEPRLMSGGGQVPLRCRVALLEMWPAHTA